MASARALAADLVNQVLLDGRSLTAALEAVRPGADARRLADAQDLAYGVLRHLGRLRFYLRRLTGRPVEPAELAGYFLVALYELADRDTPAYAAVNEAVSLVGRLYPRARGFANGVLRNFSRRRAELEAAAATDPEARWDFPRWWIDKLRADYPAAWQGALTAMNGHPPMTLRVNRRRLDVAAYEALLAEAGMAARRTGAAALTLAQPVPVSELPGFADGLVSVQDLGAQHAAALLDCADGMRVLDACAAPGGKTAHLLEGHDLDLVALDLDGERLRRVEENLRRLGLAAILRAADAGRPADWWDGRPFDRILLDAPCTGSGVVRRHPDGKWLKRCEDVTDLAGRQARLLDAVWPLLRRGGKLLYATCSLFPEENGRQVEAFLAGHEDARPETTGVPGEEDGQLLPDGDHDGFFYARIVKT
ncbi:16S rRNA (cytosine(967)-C(5))-methyltransferase RsmB [Parasulfuritortus cantonensis]|uniref:16S rRNA (cytosine(967)-C(5))-methyltransferase n=1 Tax=Parasulfuritortus cantonensis TaxID=2528202 RepID=A0A4R1B5U8_9PROT|nr:16S rRNA (cytosine(967)-C(5))-methyltransferase RsmB [Parasulfuritortus cantonensis]TCJ12920.1 16S rRNA (cytosine(967)-C(5))-methyltransferase RsmB [Parasulfuritortus cantonensis]